MVNLGERQSVTASLEAAIAACRAALEENARSRVPLEWARTQMNLGSALKALGEQESGTARLQEAVTAYREALEENMRSRVPLEWARAQMNLGGAVSALGQRAIGTASLEAAVTAYRAALEENTRERVPLEWARTQMNLCLTISTFPELRLAPSRSLLDLLESDKHRHHEGVQQVIRPLVGRFVADAEAGKLSEQVISLHSLEH